MSEKGKLNFLGSMHIIMGKDPQVNRYSVNFLWKAKESFYNIRHIFS